MDTRITPLEDLRNFVYTLYNERLRWTKITLYQNGTFDLICITDTKNGSFCVSREAEA